MLFQLFRTAVFLFKGHFEFTNRSFVEKSKHWLPLEFPNEKKVILVTGGNAGLGKATVEQCIEIFQRSNKPQQQMELHVLCRSEQKGKEAIQEFEHQIGNTTSIKIHLHICDLMQPKWIEQFTNNFMQQTEQLDVLINNAGALFHERKETPDGLEATFATNSLSTFLLTTKLLPLLRKNKTQENPARVINISSGGAYTVKLEPIDVQLQKQEFNNSLFYSQTKRQQIVMAAYWAKKYEKDPVRFYSMHPGWCETPGFMSSLPEMYNLYKNRVRTAKQGIDTVCWLALSDEPLEQNGKFFFDRQVTPEHATLCRTQETPEDVEIFMSTMNKWL